MEELVLFPCFERPSESEQDVINMLSEMFKDVSLVNFEKLCLSQQQLGIQRQRVGGLTGEIFE